MAGRTVAFPAEETERRNYWVAICKVKDTCLKSVQHVGPTARPTVTFSCGNRLPPLPSHSYHQGGDRFEFSLGAAKEKESPVIAVCINFSASLSKKWIALGNEWPDAPVF